MKRNIIDTAIVFSIVLSPFFLFSCSVSKKIKKPTPIDMTNPPTIDQIESDLTFPLIVSQFTKTDDEMKVKIKQAIIKMSETMTSQCFQDFWSSRKLQKTNGRNNSEVYSHLKTPMIIDVEMYYTSSNVYGKTYPSQMKLWFNTKYYNKWDSCQMASNIGHERSHKLGYTHDYNKTKNRPYSVPYSIGTGIKNCCKE